MLTFEMLITMHFCNLGKFKKSVKNINKSYYLILIQENKYYVSYLEKLILYMSFIFYLGIRFVGEMSV